MTDGNPTPPGPDPQSPAPPYPGVGAPGGAETSYTQPSYPQAGYPPANYPQPGYPQAGYQQPGYAPGVRPMMVAPKSPGVALLASFFVPGLGSMINGEVGKGVGILIGYIVSVFLVIVIIGIFGVFGFWIWGMVDGYQGAKNWNLRHGIYS